MRIRLVTQSNDFAALRPEWDQLYRQVRHRSIFLSHDWYKSAWQWNPNGGQLYVVCCERDGKLVGALPLTRKRQSRVAGATHTLEFLTVPDTQRCDALIAEDSPAVASALAGELIRRRSEWDVMRLRYIADDSAALTIFLPAMRLARTRCSMLEYARNPWIGLDTGWDSFYATRSRRLKKAVNLAANRLAKLGTVEIEWLAPHSGDRADVERALAAIIDISSRSWKTHTGNSLDNTGPQSFIRHLAYRAHERGNLSIWILKVNDRPVAMEFQLIDEGSVFALRSDFDETLGEASPGSHLSRHMLERLFGLELSRYYMGPGDNPYKYRWTESTEAVHTLTAYSPTSRGAALAAWEVFVKPKVRTLVERLRSIHASAGESDPVERAEKP